MGLMGISSVERHEPGHGWTIFRTESSVVESTVNEVVAKRMAKKQQMQWSPKGAHAMLQTRTATLNGELNQHFERWYPRFPIATDESHDLHEVKLAA
ncbi:MAG: hypothetical protein ACI8VW_002753 [bacterium]